MEEEGGVCAWDLLLGRRQKLVLVGIADLSSNLSSAKCGEEIHSIQHLKNLYKCGFLPTSKS